MRHIWPWARGAARTRLRPRRPASLAGRLTLWNSISVVLLLVLAAASMYWALVSRLNREDGEFLDHEVRVVRDLLATWPASRPGLRQEVISEWGAGEGARLEIRILDQQGKEVLASVGMGAELPAARFPPPASAQALTLPTVELTAPGKARFQVAAAHASGGFVVQIGLNRTREEQVIAGYRADVGAVVGLLSLLALGVGYRITWRGIRPITEMTRAAAQIHSSTLHERLPVAGRSAELAALAATFNATLDRLEQAFAQLARFSADIAHELRTPLNSLRIGLEVALDRPRAVEEYRSALESSLEEVGRLSRLVDGLLFLARAENAQIALHAERVDLAGEARAVGEFYQPAAEQGGIRMQYELPGRLEADIDRALFQRAVGNLLENALTHTPPGGVVAMSAWRGDGRIRLRVSDTGPGIPVAHQQRVFEAFYRIDASRSTRSGGLGLGLCLVRSILRLHGGEAEIEASNGGGAAVILTLPAAPVDGGANQREARGEAPRKDGASRSLAPSA